MAFSQPVLRQEKRQAMPESISGRERGSIGIGAGLKSHGMSQFPKAGLNAHPGGMGISSGIKPIAKLAGGGIYNFDPLYYPDQDVSNDPSMQGGQGANLPLDSGAPSVKFSPITSGLNQNMINNDPSTANLTLPTGAPGIQNSAQTQAFNQNLDNASAPSSWGKAAMQGGTSALMGILGNLSNQQVDKSAIKQNAAAAVIPTRASNPGIQSVSVRGHAAGGMIHQDFAQGGQVMHNSGNPGTNDGGLSSPPQQSATPNTMPQQPQGQSAPDANSPISQALAAKAIQALLGQSQNPQQDIQAFTAHFGQEALQALVQKVQESKQGQNAPGQPNMGQGIVGGQQQPAGASQPATTPAMASPQQGIAQGMASGGETGSRDENGLLSGDGGGMDDRIHSNGSQVRVADSEFVIPADAVSQLGDGSTKEGARKLTQGIANLRQQKYGHAKQPKKLGPNKNPIMGN